MKIIALLFSTTFFSGLIFGKKGKGGGLIGSIVAFVIQAYFIFNDLGAEANTIFIYISFIVGILSIPSGEKYILQKWGAIKRHTGEVVTSDFNQTNIDEVHGQSIAGAVAFMFNITPYGQIGLLILSFILFRYFDVKKTYPIKNIERNLGNNALGIMIDDSIGGIMACGVVLIAFYTVLLFLSIVF